MLPHASDPPEVGGSVGYKLAFIEKGGARRRD